VRRNLRGGLRAARALRCHARARRRGFARGL